ncbi:MAG: LptF/LptG family permease [Niastella sp.]|nr:LptF/LptG family permease [Niastella sp.]
MFRKLDKLILKAFLGPFIITFFIALFVLMMQILWKYIDDLVGKGLDFITIIQFIWYAGASLITLAMPIAILISSIMTFGNLGESFELVAIKASGISLLRFMRPIMWVSVLFCGITYVFANNVIPYANLKFVTLYNDIYLKKPAFDLKEGVFFTYIPNYAIKVGKKDKDGKTIHDIVIYEKGNNLQDNTISARDGVMNISDNQVFLEFNLKNGYRYQERGNYNDTATEYIRVGFKEFSKLFDLSSLQKQKTNDSIFKNNSKMLSARQLNKNIDSAYRSEKKVVERAQATFNNILHFAQINDSAWKKANVKQSAPVIPDSVKLSVKSRALYVAQQIKSEASFASADINKYKGDLLFSKIEWHRKFAFSLSCMVLFFIGAPLGSIIRKGGIGMPLVVAIIFFLIFHLLNMFGEKFVKENILSPEIGMWLSIIVLTPVGIFLTYKAMHDSQLFSKEFYYRSYKKLKRLLQKNKPIA